MARIVVITHEYDMLLHRRGLLSRLLHPRGLLSRTTSSYMLYDILLELQRRGHEFRVTNGPSGERGDAAIMHVDATIVPEEYLAYGRSFPICLNLAATDISKRRVSGARWCPDSGWDGPVIVKSNLNAGGYPEWRINQRARQAGRPEPLPATPPSLPYEIHESPAGLSAHVLDDPALSVERFVAEPDPDGFALRFWVFCGEAERCTRYVSPKRLIKGAETIRSEPAPVPDELRRRRRELGFDYGKFDFVVHAGEAILLDANKTPGRPESMEKMLAKGTSNLADGLEGMLAGRGR